MILADFSDSTKTKILRQRAEPGEDELGLQPELSRGLLVHHLDNGPSGEHPLVE